jgi:hypothetical protein
MEVAHSFSALNGSRFNAAAGRKLNLFKEYRDGNVGINQKNGQNVKKRKRNGTEERRKRSMGRCIMYKHVN